MALASILIAIHVLAAVYWVGGMAFAYTILRPAAGPMQPADRLGLWRRVFGRFLHWAGVSALTLIITGFWMIFAVFGGFAGAPMYVHIMLLIGLIMTAIYFYLVFSPWRRFKKSVDGGQMEDAAKALDTIRKIVATNTTLGVITIALAAGGQFM